MVICTWHGCSEAAAKTQHDRDGKPWAELCARHALELDAAVTSGKPKDLCRAWVRAQGGPEAAAKRMQPAIKAAASLLKAIGAKKA